MKAAAIWIQLLIASMHLEWDEETFAWGFDFCADGHHTTLLYVYEGHEEYGVLIEAWPWQFTQMLWEAAAGRHCNKVNRNMYEYTREVKSYGEEVCIHLAMLSSWEKERGGAVKAQKKA